MQKQWKTWKIIYSSKSACADWLAKCVAGSEYALCTWDICPPLLHPLLLADAMGVVMLWF